MVVEEVESPSRSWVERIRARAPEREQAPVEMSERRRERLAERKRIRVRRLSVVGGATALVLLLVWILAFSPLLAFRAGNVEVQGAAAGTVSTGQVGAALRRFDGTPLVRLDAAAAEKAIEKAVPAVGRAEVSRSFPHGLSVKVTLRVPVACLEREGGCTAVDAEGVRFELPKEATAKLPKLTLDAEDETHAIDVMVRVLGSLDRQTREAIASVSVSQTNQVTFTLGSGATVAWGVAKDNERKAAVLRVLLTQQARRYDVSAPNAPVTE